MEKNDNPHNEARGDDDERLQGGSGDDDVFIQAAALAGERNNDAAAGRYHIVDEGGPVSVRKIFFYSIQKLNVFIIISKNDLKYHFSFKRRE
jgi:hypothetical protein